MSLEISLDIENCEENLRYISRAIPPPGEHLSVGYNCQLKKFLKGNGQVEVDITTSAKGVVTARCNSESTCH